MFRSLGEFVDALERAGELRRIAAPVSPILEIAEITDRVSKSRAPNPPSHAAQRSDPRFADRGGHALLFDNVEGSGIPVLINAFGSYRRMEMALGCHAPGPGTAGGRTPAGFDGIGAKIGELVKPEPPRSIGEAIAKARQFAPLLRIGPKRLRGAGRCQEVVHHGDDADVDILPIIKCWPLDGEFGAMGYPAGLNDGIEGVDTGGVRGRYITMAGVHTIHADDAGAARPSSHNIGMYRVQRLGRRRLAMHWHVHHDGASHWRSWKRRGEPMPVAIALGGESVLPYAATCPLPPGISELLMAGFLGGRGVELCRAKTVPLWVPANAEIVIEGYVSHRAGPIGWVPGDGPLGEGAVFEGPFGDHTGFYSLPDRYPIVEVTAITHRRSPVFPATIVGYPVQEDYFLGKATERIMLPLLRTIIHDVEDYDLPLFGAFHNAACLRIDKAYPMQGRRLMHSVWGAGQMAWTKMIFVVDADVGVHDTAAVLRAAARRCRPDRDIELVNGPLDILDHAAPRLGAGTKIGFDCTRKWAGEEVGGVPVETGKDEPPEPIISNGARAAYLRRVRDLERVRAAALPDELARGWLLVSIDKDGPGRGADVIEQLRDAGAECAPPFVIVLGPDADVDDVDNALFHWCAHTDAGRDARFFHSPDGSGERVSRVAFDATPKLAGDERNGEPVRRWPPLLRMDGETRDKVDRRWSEYGLRS